MSADLFAAFVTGDGNSSSVKPNVPDQAHDVATQSLGAELHSTTRLSHTSIQQLEEGLPLPLWQKDSQGADVLFDAEAAEEDDEFGDFEDVDAGDALREVPKPLMQNDISIPTRQVDPTQNTHTPDLISLEPENWGTAIDSSPSEDHKQKELQVPLSHKHDTGEPQAAWNDDWDDFEQTPPAVIGKSRLASQPTKDDSGPANDTDEDWDAFEDGQPQQSQSDMSDQNPNPAASVNPGRTPVPNEAVERPTNVPPPSMLLQLLSSVFEAVRELNNTGKESKQVLGPRVLTIFRVVSRIIAGRSLRWKRDTILAQSMRIGQAGSSRGMKLASVNRGENAREEREVEDLIGHWSRYTHEFNSILTQAHMTGYRLKLSSSPSLRVLKGSGTSKQCALCGLQRTERINGIDTDIEDLFGEFWVEHWGHKDCCEFWYLYKELLSQR